MTHGCTSCPKCSRCTICGGCNCFKENNILGGLYDMDDVVDKLSKTDSELQHMKHMYEGYRGFVCGEPNPLDEGSARSMSWWEGWQDAQQDFDQWHPLLGT